MTEPVIDVAQALQQHWEAKNALAYWKDRERVCRMQLADALSDAEQEGYKNKTIALSDGTKLVMEVARKLKVDVKSDSYKAFINSAIQGALSAEQLAAFRKEKTTVEFSLSGYNTLPESMQNALGSAVQIQESVSIDYKRPTEQR